MSGNSVTIRATAPGAKEAAGEVKGLRDAFDLLQKQGAKGFAIGVGAAATAKAIDLVGDATHKATEFIGDSIGAASDLNETMSKSQVIFGDSADEVEKWADSAATAFGQSKTQALDTASGFAGLFQTVGLAAGQSKDYAMDLTQMGSDLASFFNTDVQSAIDSLKSGLSGEAEPLKKFNVFLSETAVNAKAIEMGFVKVDKQWTESQKVQARYALIMEQTTAAQGDFARTSDGLANSQRTLDAQMEDLHATVGQALLPVMQSLTGVAKDALAVFQSLDPGAQQLIAGLAGLVAVGTPAVLIFNQMTNAFGTVFGVIGKVITAVIGHTTATVADTAATEANTVAQNANKTSLLGAGAALGVFAAGVEISNIASQGMADQAKAATTQLQGMTNVTADQAAEFIHNAEMIEQNINSTKFLGVVDTDATRAQLALAQQFRDSAAAAGENEAAVAAVGSAYDDGAAQLDGYMTHLSGLADGAREAARAAGQAAADGFNSSKQGIADDAREAVRFANQAMMNEAENADRVGDKLADALLQGLPSAHDAWKQYLQDQKNTLDPMKEMAWLQARLAGDKLAEGLASKNPLQQRRAEIMRDTIMGQIDDLQQLMGTEGTQGSTSLGNHLVPGPAVASANEIMRRLANIFDHDFKIGVDIAGGRMGGQQRENRAKGGPVEAGKPYLVNEDTPNSEIFVPGVDGAIVPRTGSNMGPLGGGSGSVQVAVTVNLSTREFAARNRHHAVIQAGAPTF